MKKIMFNDKYGLTEAVLSGRKTQTRRIIKRNQLFKRDPDGMWTDDEKKAWEKSGISESDFSNEEEMRTAFEWLKAHAPYKIGEVVAVAQAYNDFYNDDHNPIMFPDGAGWTNKMFVRAALMPHRIRITNVRAERLNDISEADCIKEGVDSWVCRGKRYFGFFDNTKNRFSRHLTPREAYAELIDKISKKGTWESNPYVFVYDFELVK